jgi:hypothetical protein
MQESIVALSIPIIALVGSFTMIIFLRKYRNDEIMAMIAKGITPPAKTSFEVNPNNSLRWGFILIGFGVGLLMGSVLESLTQLDGEVAHFSMILIFGGLGLLASYFYQMNLDKKNKQNNH